MTAARTVEMGETGVAGAADVCLEARGLGACVGLCLYDGRARVAVLAHIVLPQALPQTFPQALSQALPSVSLPGKCADTAVAHSLGELTRRGGDPARAVAALVGGASIFSAPTSPPTRAADDAGLSRLEVGPRNVRAVRAELGRAGVPLCAEETGGHAGRTVSLDARTGEVWVRPVGLPARLLTTLRSGGPVGAARGH